VAVIIFHGTADRLVPMAGGTTPFQIGSKRRDTPVAETVAFWVKHNGCNPIPKHEETGELHIDTYGDCKEAATVALYSIQGGRHAWPGTPIAGNHVPATDLMWSFFAAHRKP
jgi:polyhydroxybutyrate depolymerase